MEIYIYNLNPLLSKPTRRGNKLTSTFSTPIKYFTRTHQPLSMYHFRRTTPEPLIKLHKKKRIGK